MARPPVTSIVVALFDEFEGYAPRTKGLVDRRRDARFSSEMKRIMGRD